MPSSNGVEPLAQSNSPHSSKSETTSFDYPNQALVFEGKKQLITTKEADILRLLCLNKGNLLDRQTTLRELWGENDYFNRRSMDVFISKLRKYLQQRP